MLSWWAPAGTRTKICTCPPTASGTPRVPRPWPTGASIRSTTISRTCFTTTALPGVPTSGPRPSAHVDTTGDAENRAAIAVVTLSGAAKVHVAMHAGTSRPGDTKGAHVVKELPPLHAGDAYALDANVAHAVDTSDNRVCVVFRPLRVMALTPTQAAAVERDVATVGAATASAAAPGRARRLR